MKYLVRKSFGDSDSSYGGGNLALLLNPPPQVLGQRNGADPEIWVNMRTPILNCIKDEGN